MEVGYIIRESHQEQEAIAVFEHTATPSVFFKSRIHRGRDGWELTSKDGTVYAFQGGVKFPLLQSIRDRHGNKISIGRGGGEHPKVTRVISPNGLWLELKFDRDDINGRIIQARDNIGRVVTYDYDDNGRLITVTDPMGGVTEYTYDTSNRMLAVKDARAITFLTNEYDDGDRVIKQTQADGSTYQFEYTVDANGKITQTVVTDPRGNYPSGDLQHRRLHSNRYPSSGDTGRANNHLRATAGNQPSAKCH